MEASAKYQLNPKLIAAIIFQESGGDPFAFRYEPAFYEKHFKNRSRRQLIGHISKMSTLATELISRSCSYGLMQILGETARENGFDGDFLTALFDPRTNIDFGCGLLFRWSQKVPDMESLLLRWNGGGRPEYPKEVIRHMESGESDFLLM